MGALLVIFVLIDIIMNSVMTDLKEITDSV